MSEQKDQYMVATLAVFPQYLAALSCYWPFMNKELNPPLIRQLRSAGIWERITCKYGLGFYLHIYISPGLAAIWEELGNQEISILALKRRAEVSLPCDLQSGSPICELNLSCMRGECGSRNRGSCVPLTGEVCSECHSVVFILID